MEPQVTAALPTFEWNGLQGPGRPATLRLVNAAQILWLIRQKGRCSRMELARACGLSPPAVASSVEYLRRQGLIQTVGRGRSRGGRPPELIAFRPRRGYVVGVELERTGLRLALADLSGTLVNTVDRHLGTSSRPEEVVTLVLEGVEELLRKAGIPRRRLLAVGMAVPGVTDPHTGAVRAAPHLQGWRNVPLRVMLSSRLGIAVGVENDVNLGAVGESLAGRARGVRNFVFLGVGAGVGAGIYLDGRLYRGSHCTGGEIGYLLVPGASTTALDLDRPGPLESSVGTLGIEQIWREGGGQPARLSAVEILDRAAAGHTLARKIARRAARVLAEAVLNLSVILDPELVVFGGPLGLHPFLFELTAQRVQQSRLIRPALVRSALGAETQLVGAVWMASRLAEARLLCPARRPGAPPQQLDRADGAA
jgi:glucokinase